MFIVIWGWRWSTRRTDGVMYMCPHCGTGPHSVYKQVKRFTLFWIPLFPVKTQYSLLCASCYRTTGASPYAIPRQEAERLLASVPVRQV